MTILVLNFSGLREEHRGRGWDRGFPRGDRRGCGRQRHRHVFPLRAPPRPIHGQSSHRLPPVQQGSRTQQTSQDCRTLFEEVAGEDNQLVRIQQPFRGQVTWVSPFGPHVWLFLIYAFPFK